ncbi:hypothetical protein ACFSCY_18340, partial [Pseudonocardia aurantiaca]
MPGGYWDAFGEATCSGGGSSGGGCGVTAYAVAGPGGGGGGKCSGSYSSCHTDGGNTFTSTVPQKLAPGMVLDKNGRPVPIEELGPDEQAVLIERDENGDVVWKIKPKGGEAYGDTCAAPCTGVDERGPGGERVTFDPNGGDEAYRGGMPIEPGSDKRDEASGSEGVRLARDREGDGGGWVRGRGQVTNGRTGETIRYTRVADSDKPRNDFRLSNAAGSPFQSSCNGGCVYTGAELPGDAGRDRLTVEGSWGTITGRDGHGNPARISFDGKGHFVSAEGDTLTSPTGMAQGRVDIVTRNALGLGGSISLNGWGTIISAEGAQLQCYSCEGTHYMPTERGKGGISTCKVGPGGSCNGVGAEWKGGQDYQTISVRRGGSGDAEFVQFLRGADGSGGGAVAFVNGDGEAYGTDAFGNWVQTSGKGGRTGLLYAEADGYNKGQACVAGEGGSCRGSEPVERRLEWVEPTKDVTKALGLYGPGERPPGFIGPVAPSGSASLLNRGRAAFAFTRDQGHLRWMAEDGNEQVQPVVDAFAEAKRGGITPEEASALAEQINALDPATRERLGRTGDALDTVLTVKGTQERSTEDIERQLAENPQLVRNLLGEPNLTDPSQDQLTRAKNILLDQQAVSRQAAQDLGELRPRQDALDRRQAAYERALQDYYAGRGGNYKDLEAERVAINEQAAALATDRRPFLDDLDQSQGTLRAYDAYAAGVAGDPAYAGDIALARRNLDAVAGVVEAMPAPETQKQLDTAVTIATFSDAVRMGYEAAIEAPRPPSNRLNDMHLPSTGSADLALALRSAAGYDYIQKVADDANSPFANLNPDQLSNVAATWTYGDRDPAQMTDFEVARLGSTPSNADQVAGLLLGWRGTTDQERAEYDERKDAIFRQINQSWLRRNVGSVLSDGERERVGDLVNDTDPKSVMGFFEFMLDGAHWTTAESVRQYNKRFGASTDHFGRNLGRDAVTLGAGLLSLPGVVIGGGVVEGRNRIKSEGWGAALYLSPVTGIPRMVDSMVNPEDYFDEPRKPGESETDYYNRVAPLSGSLIRTPLANAGHRWFGDGDVSDDYHDRPLVSFMEDALPILVVAGPVAAGFRGGAAAAAARASTARAGLARINGLAETPATAALARSLGSDIARFEGQAARRNAISQIASVPLHVINAPFTAVGLPVRAAALGVRMVAAPAARGARAAGTAAAGRALLGSLTGRSTAGAWMRTSSALDGAAGRLGRAADWGRATTRYGLFGKRGEGAAYREIGASRAAADQVVRDAYTARAARIKAGGKAGDPVRAARLDRLERSLQMVEQRRVAVAARQGGTAARERQLAEEIDVLLELRGNTAQTVASIARELGVSKRAVRGALSRELAEGAGVGSGPRIGLARDRSGAPAVVRPEGGETAAARFDRFLADEIDARLADNGDAPMTVASLARELGVKKSAIRTALNQDAVARGDAGAGMRTQVVRDGNGTVWVQRPDPFAALPDSAPRPGRGPVRGTPAQQALAEQIDAALSARGDGPVTLASLARELGVRKNQIRDALRADAGDRAAAGTGPRAEVVYDRDGTGRVQRPDRDGTGDGGDAPSSPPGPAPGQQQPDGMPAGSSAGGARPQKNTSG